MVESDQQATIEALSEMIDAIERLDQCNRPVSPMLIGRLVNYLPALATGCDTPDISRLEYAPHRVSVAVHDTGEILPTGHNELLDDSWRSTATYYCHGCDTELGSELIAYGHAKGVDLRDLVPDVEETITP